MKTVILTAGFNKAKNVIALAELLKSDGIKISAVLVVSPFSLKRTSAMIRQRGRQALYKSFKRIVGIEEATNTGNNPLDNFLAKHNIFLKSIKSWCLLHGVPYIRVSSLNDSKAINVVKRYNNDVVVYGGGGILKDDFINAAKGKILNAHSGPLPEIRGMNACEWTLLLGYELAVTIHYINRGIDTGAIIRKIPVKIARDDSIEILRSKCIVEGIKGLREELHKEIIDPIKTNLNNSHYRQCYILAPALYELLEKKLMVKNVLDSFETK